MLPEKDFALFSSLNIINMFGSFGLVELIVFVMKTNYFK